MHLTGEHTKNKWKVAFPSASPLKNKLPRLKLHKTITSRLMQAVHELTLLKGARSGFERAGSYANDVNRIARLESRAITLRNFGVALKIPLPLMENTAPEH